MFPSRATSGQHSSATTHGKRHGIRSRRLRVELMEGRLMLSATMPQTTPFDLYNVHLRVSSFQLAPAGEQVAVVGAPLDGGFITGDVIDSIPRTNVSFEVPSSVNTYLSNNALNISDRFSTSGNGGLQLFDAAFDSGGLQPAVIVTLSNGTGLESNITPILAGPPADAGGAEGGSIPIHNVLAGLRNNAGLAAGEISLSSLTKGKLAEPRLSPRLATASESAMSGEWARAMVFEIAGGEPGSSGRATLGEQDEATRAGEKATQRDEPPSRIETTRQHKIASRRNDVAQAGESSHPFERSRDGTGQTAGKSAAVASPIQPSDVTPFLINGSSSNSASSTPSASSSAGDSVSFGSAASAAVEQLDDGKAAFVESSSAGDTWSRLAAATPLLMVLAMERIAALNARRAAKEASRRSSAKADEPDRSKH